jgi:signal peptidase II
MPLFFFLVAFDIVSKKIAAGFLHTVNQIVLIPGILKLLYVENQGAAFGILLNARYFLIGVSSIAFLVFIYCYFKKLYKDNFQYYGLILLAAGTFGNLLDRVWRGAVIDFIDLPYWPTFNFADIFINVGVLLIFISIYRQQD